MGRQLSDNPASAQIHIRVTPEVRDKLVRKATRAGADSLSAYMIECGLAGLAEPKVKTKAKPKRAPRKAN